MRQRNCESAVSQVQRVTAVAVLLEHRRDRLLRAGQRRDDGFLGDEETFDVAWLWMAFSAATTAAGASVQPRQPVIAASLMPTR